MSDDYVLIAASILRNKKVSLGAIGLFVIISSIPSDFRFSLTQLCNLHIDTKEQILAAFKELATAGYLNFETTVNNKGDIINVEYTFCKKPRQKSPISLGPGGCGKSFINQEF